MLWFCQCISWLPFYFIEGTDPSNFLLFTSNNINKARVSTFMPKEHLKTTSRNLQRYLENQSAILPPDWIYILPRKGKEQLQNLVFLNFYKTWGRPLTVTELKQSCIPSEIFVQEKKKFQSIFRSSSSLTFIFWRKQYKTFWNALLLVPRTGNVLYVQQVHATLIPVS